MPIIDPTTPSGVQPQGFSSGYTLTMSDEFNSSTLDSKWHGRHDFSDSGAITAWDVNNGGNSALRMWFNGSTSSNNRNQMFSSTGATPFRQRYGFFEARVKMIRGKGFFPGFWLYPYSDSEQENPDGQAPEIDVVEWFSYENGDWLVDTTNFRCKNAVFTVWTEGGGGSTATAGSRNLGATGGYVTNLSTEYHTYGLRWTQANGLQWYFDGAPRGSVIPDPWGSSQASILPAVFLQLWWGPNGGNPVPNTTNTPVGSSNALEWDYVRAWTIGGGGGPTFSATVTTAPANGATISGVVPFAISGDLIQNAELLPPTGYVPSYGTFMLTGDSIGNLNWDTTGLPNGPISVRIAAFDTPAGTAGDEITAMATRTYTIANTGTVSMPVCTSFDIV